MMVGKIVLWTWASVLIAGMFIDAAWGKLRGAE